MKKNKGASLNLPSEIRISNNTILIKKLKTVIENGYSKIVVDISKTEEIDLSSLQILNSFYKECLAENIDVDFKGPLKDKIKKQLLSSGFLEIRGQHEILFPFLGNKGAEIGNR